MRNSVVEKYNAPWHFDGHGANDTNGERICKVACGGPYIYPEGLPVRNERFDDLSRLITAAPEMLSIIEDLIELAESSERGNALSVKRAKLMVKSIYGNKK